MVRPARVLRAAVLLAVLPAAAHADPLRCQSAIAKESAKYVQSITKAILRCEDARASGQISASTNCPNDPATASAILTSRNKLAAKVARRCGGGDRTCGTPDDEPLGSIGWGSGSCPGLENASCNNTITDCDDIGVCLACVGEAAVEQAAALYYDFLATGQFGNGSALNSCQRAVGREAGRFLRSKSKALQKCWDARLKGKHGNPCPVPGDGRAADRIQRAEAKKVANICRACGGADGCGGSGDFTPAEIGFRASCLEVTVPGGASCGTPISTLQDIVDCVDCVTEFKVDCTDAIAVPVLEPYPSECLPTTTTTSLTSTTSTSTTSTVPPSCPPPALPIGSLDIVTQPGSPNCGGAALTPGPAAPFTGEVRDHNGAKISDLAVGCLYFGGGNATSLPPVSLAAGGTSVLSIASTSGTTLNLAASNGTGPADCTRGPGPNKHCVTGTPGTDNMGACTTDADCGYGINVCVLDANCFFGPPTPLSLTPTALSSCVVNAIARDVCGSADVASGSTSVSVSLSARLYLTGNAQSPCPRCLNNVCSGGERAGLSCSGGVGSQNTTVECPPLAKLFTGSLDVVLSPLTTGSTTFSSDADGFFCPGQVVFGAFGRRPARSIVQTGSPLNLLTMTSTVAGTFCVPSSGSGLIDNLAGVPGPAAVAVKSMSTVHIP